MSAYTITGFVLDDDTLNFKDTTYSNATTSEDGLMSATDKEKLEDAIQNIATMGEQILDAMSAKFYNNSNLPSTITANQILNLPTGMYQNRGSVISAIPSQYGELIVFKHAYYTGLLYFAAGGLNVRQLYYAIEPVTATVIDWVQVAKA